MPAPIALTSAPVLNAAEAGAPGSAATADPVPFDALLAALLGDPGAVDAAQLLPLTEAPPGDGPPLGGAQTDGSEALPEALPELLAAAATSAVPVELPPSPAPATPLQAAETPAARGALPQGSEPPDGRVVTTSIRLEAASAALTEDPGVSLPRAATIAAPAPSQVAAQPPEAVPLQGAPAAERKINPEPAPLPQASIDGPAGPLAASVERLDPGARTANQPPVRAAIAAPLGNREFGAEFGARVMWMAANNHQVAELRIDPPQLGPVEVRLAIANDQATLSISSPHAAVRDAVQASLPRLHDMLQGLGITLGNVSVGAEGFGAGHFDPSSGQWRDRGESSPQTHRPGYPVQSGTAVVAPLRSGAGVIDVYA